MLLEHSRLFIVISMSYPLASIFLTQSRLSRILLRLLTSLSETGRRKESAIQSNPDNLPAHLDLACTYLGWEWVLSRYSVQKQSLQLINKVIAEYDTYLASNDSDEVRVDRLLRACSMQETKRCR